MGLFSCLNVFSGARRGSTGSLEKKGTRGNDSLRSEPFSDHESKRIEDDSGTESQDEKNEVSHQRKSIIRTWASEDQLARKPYETTEAGKGRVILMTTNAPQTTATTTTRSSMRPSTAPRLQQPGGASLSGPSPTAGTKVSFSNKEDRPRSSRAQTPIKVGVETQYREIDHGQEFSSRVYTSENVKSNKRNSKR